MLDFKKLSSEELRRCVVSPGPGAMARAYAEAAREELERRGEVSPPMGRTSGEGCG